MAKRKLSTEITISDLKVEGLEGQKSAFLNSVKQAQESFYLTTENTSLADQDGIKKATLSYNKSLEAATKIYSTAIEKNLNQPIEVVLQNANTTNLNDIVVAYRDAGAKATERMKEGAAGKTLTEKPKSSKDGIALAGYIPIEQSFGKAGESGQTERFNKIIEERFKKGKVYEDQLNGMIKDLNSGKIKEPPAELKEVLEHNPVAKTAVKDKEGREIYGLVDEKGHAIRDNKGKAAFAYKDEQGVYCNEIDGKPTVAQRENNFKKIEALSYISGIEKNSETGNFEFKTQKITGDHDQLAIGTKGIRGDKINDATITSTKGFSDDHGLAATVALIEETKKTGAVRHGQDAGGAGTKGSLSEDHLNKITAIVEKDPANISAFLKDPEIQKITASKLSGNPHPEDFTEGQYAFYQPNGKVSVAHNEAEIVQMYNKVEAKGYNIDINPRYGWQRTTEGKLEIDPNKLSAQAEIMANTANQETILRGPKFDDLTPLQRAQKADKVNNDAEKIYELASLNSLIKLQEPSEAKEVALAATKKMLRVSEALYLKEHDMMPPSVTAIADKKQKELVINKLQKMQAYLPEHQNPIPKPLVRRASDPLLNVAINSNEPKLSNNLSEKTFGHLPPLAIKDPIAPRKLKSAKNLPLKAPGHLSPLTIKDPTNSNKFKPPVIIDVTKRSPLVSILPLNSNLKLNKTTSIRSH